VAETRRYGTAAWELEVPAGMLGSAVEPPSDSPYDSMFVLRGWLNDTAPATLVVTTRLRKGVSLRVSEDGIDRIATVVAAGRRSLVPLSIRTRPADEAAAEVERRIRSLTLLDA
jgi:hypothetical protein